MEISRVSSVLGAGGAVTTNSLSGQLPGTTKTVGNTSITSPARPAADLLTSPPATTNLVNQLTVNFWSDKSKQIYQQWKTNYVKFYWYDASEKKIKESETAPDGQNEIYAFAWGLDPAGNWAIISENMAWALLLAVNFNDEKTFKALLEGLKKIQQFGLPSWKSTLNSDKQLIIVPAERSSASNADQDTAFALIAAWQKVKKGQWRQIDKGFLQEYLTWFLEQIWEDEVEYNGISYLFKPSEDWGASGTGVGTAVNISYPQVAFFELFENFAAVGSHVWQDLGQDVLTLREQLILGDDQKEHKGQVGFTDPGSKKICEFREQKYAPPDWVAVGRQKRENLIYEVPNRSSLTGPDGLRTFWRIAFDALYSQNPDTKKRSIELAREIVRHYSQYQNDMTQVSVKVFGKDNQPIEYSKKNLLITPIFAALAKAACQKINDQEQIEPVFSSFFNKMKDDFSKMKDEDYQSQGNEKEHYANSLRLLSMMILGENFQYDSATTLWRPDGNRDLEVLAAHYPYFRDSGILNIVLDLRYYFLSSGPTRADLDVLNSYKGLLYQENSEHFQTIAELWNHLDLAQRLMSLGKFYGAFCEYMTIIQTADYHNKYARPYLVLAFDGLAGAYLKSGMEPHLFLKYVQTLVSANHKNGQKNPYIDLVHANALFLTYDPDKFKESLGVCRNILKNIKEANIQDPILTARTVMIIIQVYLDSNKESMKSDEKKALEALVKISKGENVSQEDRDLIISSGFLSDEELTYVETTQKKLGEALRVGIWNYLCEYGRSQTVPQTDDPLTYLLTFTQARIKMAMAEDKNMPSGEKQRILKEAEKYLYQTLAGLPRSKEESAAQMAINVFETLFYIYRNLYGLSQDSRYLAYNRELANFLIYLSCGRAISSDTSPSRLSQVSRGISDLFRNESSAGEKPVEIKSIVNQFPPEQQTNVTQALEQVQTIILENRQKVPQYYFDAAWQLSGKKWINPQPYLRLGELTLRLGLLQAEMAEFKAIKADKKQDIFGGIGQLARLLPRNRVRQNFDRVYFYLVKGEKESAREYIDDILQIVNYIQFTPLQLLEKKYISEKTPSGTAVPVSFDNLEVSLRYLTYSIREGLLALNDIDQLSSRERTIIQNCTVHIKKIKQSLDDKKIMFWSRQEREGFKTQLELFEKMVTKIAQQGPQITVSEFLQNFSLDRMNNLEILANKAERLGERIKALRHLAELKSAGKSKEFQLSKELEVLRSIEQFKRFLGNFDINGLDTVYRKLLTVCESELKENGYPGQLYQEVLQWDKEIIWFLSGDLIGKILNNETVEKLSEDNQRLQDSYVIVCDVLDLPYSLEGVSEEVKKLIICQRDPENYGMKASLLQEKKFLKKDFYLLLMAIELINKHQAEAADAMNKLYYSNPNDFQTQRLARVHFISKSIPLKFNLPAETNQTKKGVSK